MKKGSSHILWLIAGSIPGAWVPSKHGPLRPFRSRLPASWRCIGQILIARQHTLDLWHGASPAPWWWSLHRTGAFREFRSILRAVQKQQASVFIDTSAHGHCPRLSSNGLYGCNRIVTSCCRTSNGTAGFQWTVDAEIEGFVQLASTRGKPCWLAGLLARFRVMSHLRQWSFFQN